MIVDMAATPTFCGALRGVLQFFLDGLLGFWVIGPGYGGRRLRRKRA